MNRYSTIFGSCSYMEDSEHCRWCTYRTAYAQGVTTRLFSFRVSL